MGSLGRTSTPTPESTTTSAHSHDSQRQLEPRPWTSSPFKRWVVTNSCGLAVLLICFRLSFLNRQVYLRTVYLHKALQFFLCSHRSVFLFSSSFLPIFLIYETPVNIPLRLLCRKPHFQTVNATYIR